ncbi:DUF4136 domain-containing protein [Novosphingobium profundi]|uniref:DUF4136 domain-containing protein n=1 Tax=Novosphingobium profundi TaxID=1774954 RepID=UPI001CFD1BFA|nr:DUF4136 domain-containing protein [Novosphingobium profundi]
MRTRFQIFPSMIALAVLASCSTTPRPSFKTEAAPDINLASYRTYTWAFPKRDGGNPFVYERVQKAIDASLAQAGYALAADGEGDMELAFTLGARDRVDVTNWGPVAPYYPGYGRNYRYGWAYQYNQVDVRNVTEGSLALDVFDAKTDRPIWHGIASARIGSSDSPSDELIQSAAKGLVDRLVAGQMK